jgi:GDSL-like Lipase/Acylhydrolase family
MKTSERIRKKAEMKKNEEKKNDKNTDKLEPIQESSNSDIKINENTIDENCAIQTVAVQCKECIVFINDKKSIIHLNNELKKENELLLRELKDTKLCLKFMEEEYNNCATRLDAIKRKCMNRGFDLSSVDNCDEFNDHAHQLELISENASATNRPGDLTAAEQVSEVSDCEILTNSVVAYDSSVNTNVNVQNENNVINIESHRIEKNDVIESRGEYEIETIINKRSTKRQQPLNDVLVMGDSLVRLASRVVGEVNPCTYYYPGMRLENVAQALGRVLVNNCKPKVLILHFGTNNVKSAKSIDHLTGDAYDMITKIKSMLPKTTIVINGILKRRDVSAEMIRLFNNNVRWVCESLQVQYVDPNDVMDMKYSGLCRDGLHLNNRGALALGQFIVEKARDYLTKSKN